MHPFIERLGLAALRRLAPRASDSFARQALYIASRPLVDRTLDRLADGRHAAVRGGPFAGLKMLKQSSGTSHVAKILGTYEAQLHGWIERVIAASPGLIVNVGCGDGYYLCGMALRLPLAQAIGFDTDPLCRREAAETAAANGLARVRIEAEATPAALQAALVDGTIVIVDCEGAEGDILDPARTPRLRTCTMLIELHDHLVPNTTQMLHARFQDSHRIEERAQTIALPESMADRPEIERLALVCEHRECAQGWMLLTPRAA